MAKTLKDYFPLIKTRDEILAEIRKDTHFSKMFDSFGEEQQNDFLDFCTGAKGIKILYDPFFKELFSPEFHSARLERLLSLLLGEQVKIRQILPNDAVRIADENTLLITDIIVELADGSLANLEVQKIGYAFPAQRMACYSADMLLRQYKRVRTNKRAQKEKFSYRDIRTVYVFVLFDKSPKELQRLPTQYIHHARQVFDTGLQLDLIQEFILIPLDIFRKIYENKDISSELEAWLTFLAFDDPCKIIELIEKYPQFCELYADIYKMCSNTERVMDMFFSEELIEMDRNTVQYMIEEQEQELEQNKKLLEEHRIQLRENEAQLRENEQQLRENEQQLRENEAQLQASRMQISEQQQLLSEKDAEIAALKRRLQELGQA